MTFRVINRGEIESIKVYAVDKKGDPLAGKTDLYVRVRRINGDFLDWNDNQFKTSGWTTLNKLLTEIDVTNAPGLYEVTNGFNSGVTNLAANDDLTIIPLQTPGTDAVLPSPAELLVRSSPSAYVENAVWYSDIEGSSGTDKGTGPDNCVDNWTDLVSILATTSLTRVRLKGWAWLTITTDIENITFVGDFSDGFSGGGVEFSGGPVVYCAFERLYVQAVDGDPGCFNYYDDCYIVVSVTDDGVGGEYHRCTFKTFSTLQVQTSTVFLYHCDVSLASGGLQGLTIDLAGANKHVARNTAFSGKVRYTNAAHAEDAIYHHGSGEAQFDNTCDDGDGYVHGSCRMVDETGLSNFTLNDYTVAESVDENLSASHGAGDWEGDSAATIDALLSANHGDDSWEGSDAWNALQVDHTILGSFGEAVALFTQNISRILGLLHENSIVDNQVYNSVEQLTSARLRVFDSASNLPTIPGGSEVTGLLFEYAIIAEYIGGLLNEYKIERVI